MRPSHIAVLAIAILGITLLAVQSQQQGSVEKATVFVASEFRLLNHEGEPVGTFIAREETDGDPVLLLKRGKHRLDVKVSEDGTTFLLADKSTKRNIYIGLTADHMAVHLTEDFEATIGTVPHAILHVNEAGGFLNRQPLK